MNLPIFLAGCLTSIFLVSSIGAVAMRITGEMHNILFLKNTLPAKAFISIIAFIVFFLMIKAIRVAKEKNYLLTYFSCYLIILGLLVFHLIFSPPAETKDWNTHLFELMRFFSLHAVMAVPFFYDEKINAKTKKIIFNILLYVGVLLFIIAFLQIFDFIPHFYFQWFESYRLPRPTGGLNHPHFYSIILLVSMAAVYAYYTNKHPVIKYGLIILLFIGIFISTSRTGLIASLVFIIYMEITEKENRKMRFLLSKLTVAACLFIAIYAAIKINKDLGIFMESFFRSFYDSFGVASLNDDKFLRKRGYLWKIELDVIMKSKTSLLIGHGNQPFVSHNLFLRQMQVSGFIGVIFYFFMLYAFFVHAYKKSSEENKNIVVGLAISLAIASIIFPVMISVPILSGLSLLTIGLMGENKSQIVFGETKNGS